MAGEGVGAAVSRLAPVSEWRLATRIAPTLGAQDWAALVSQYEWDTATALAVLYCESGGREWEINPTGHVGLFQISPIHRWAQIEMLVPAGNVAAAFELWERGGWNPWQSSADCWRR